MPVLVKSVAEKQINPRFQLMRVVTIENDYLTCKVWDGASAGSTTHNVAKPYKLRHVVGNYDLLTTLSTTNEQEVIAGDGSTTETWRVTPLYEVNDLIYARRVGFTEVTVGDDDLWLLDINVDGKQWAVV